METMVENETQKMEAVEYCEINYPQTTDEFKKILDEMYVTFCKKQRNYGPSNISVGTALETEKAIPTAGWIKDKNTAETINNAQ